MIWIVGIHFIHLLKRRIRQIFFAIIEISELETTGHKVNDLVSVQFVRKVIRLIEENKYILQ